MSDDYKRLAIFAAVAEAGSFSGAARQLGLSTSVVSHHVSQLEARLDAVLLYRSTRSLSLTAEGEKILPHARRMRDAAMQAVDVLADQGGQLTGTLRLTLPSFGTRMRVHQRVWAFARAHPGVSLSLSSSDRPLDLIREGFDLGIRLGVLADSSLKTRRIGTFQRLLVASPEYLARHHPMKDDPAALVQCDYVGLAMLPPVIDLQRGAELVTFEPASTRVVVDTIAAARAAVLAGLGLQRLPQSEVQADIDSGALVEVMPGWRPPELGVYAVWPDTGGEKRLTRQLVEFLVDGDGAD